MKKFGMILLSLVLLGGCKTVEEPQPEPAGPTGAQGCDVFESCEDDSTSVTSLNFKEDYEALNGTENASGKEHRTITIAEDHPFVKISAAQAAEAVANGETFYLYVGDPKCPWCRSVIETAIAKAKEYGVEEIRYVEIWDEDGNEIVRDQYVLEEGAPVLKVEGAEGYAELLEDFADLLSDYTLTDEDGTVVEVGEKRIYAPNFFRIENGTAIRMTTGIPEELDDPRAELTEAMKAE